MSPGRIRSTLATLCIAAAVLASYAVFAWVEATRGPHVYPAGSLPRLYWSCGIISALLMAAALVLAVRNRGALAGQHVSPAPSPPSHRAWTLPWCLALFVLSVLFTGLAVTHSRSQGRLAFPPYYDDVQYFDDALLRLWVFHDGGIWGTLRNYWANPPHAPTSSFLAAAGYALFGTADWAPPLMNALVVFGILLYIRWVTRELPLAWALPVYGFALAWPFVFLSVVHCIPDFLTAAATAIASLVLLASAIGPRRSVMEYAAGGLFGLALLAKPAMFPVTGFIFAAVCLVCLAIEFSRNGLRGVLSAGVRSLIRASLSCLIVCGPHYLAGYKGVWNYIQDNTWGARSDLWKMKAGMWKQLLYHFTGPGGQYSMGPFLILAPVVAGLALVAALRRGRSVLVYILPWAAVFLFGHAVVSVTSYKSVFLGTFVSAFVFVTTIALLAASIRDFRASAPLFRIPVGLIVTVAVAIWGLLSFRPQPMRTILVAVFEPYPRAGVDFIREGKHRREVVERVAQRVAESGRSHTLVGVVRGNLYCVPAVFQFQMKKDRSRTVSVVDASSHGQDDAKFQAEIAPLDYIVYLMPNGAGAEARFLEVVNMRGKWRVLDRIPSEFDRATVLVLERVHDWTSVSLEMPGATGFSYPEGPYPPATFRVRWALGPAASIPFQTEEPARLVLVIEARSPHAGQEMTVLIDKRELGRFALPAGSPEYSRVSVPMDVPPGPHLVELRFLHWDKTAGQRPLAALFRRLEFTRTDQSR